MNFENLERYRFAPIDKNIRSVKETMRITAKTVTMTQAMYERMGQPQYLSFGYDAENNAIGIKVVDETDPNYTEIRFEHGTVHIIGTQFLTRKLAEVTGTDLTSKAIVLKRGVKVGDWFVFELRNAEIVTRATRKKVSA